MQARLTVIKDLVAGGHTRASVVDHCRKTLGWTLSDRQIRRLYTRMWNLLGGEAANVNRAAYFQRTIMRYDDIYKSAKDAGNLRIQADVLSALSKLLHLDIPAGDDWRDALKKQGVKPSDLVEEKLQQLAQADKRHA